MVLRCGCMALGCRRSRRLSKIQRSVLCQQAIDGSAWEMATKQRDTMRTKRPPAVTAHPPAHGPLMQLAARSPRARLCTQPRRPQSAPALHPENSRRSKCCGRCQQHKPAPWEACMSQRGRPPHEAAPDDPAVARRARGFCSESIGEVTQALLQNQSCRLTSAPTLENGRGSIPTALALLARNQKKTRQIKGKASIRMKICRRRHLKRWRMRPTERKTKYTEDETIISREIWITIHVDIKRKIQKHQDTGTEEVREIAQHPARRDAIAGRAATATAKASLEVGVRGEVYVLEVLKLAQHLYIPKQGRQELSIKVAKPGGPCASRALK